MKLVSCHFLAEWLWQDLLLGFRFGIVSAPFLVLDLLGFFLVIVLGGNPAQADIAYMVVWLSESS
jgi:hypothetical protein